LKVIIAGSRKCDIYAELLIAIRVSNFEITEVVSGCAIGVDNLGMHWAVTHNIPIARFPVTDMDWQIHGKGAGMIRNQKMTDYADALIAVWDGKSSGTRDMIHRASHDGLKVCVWRIDLQAVEKEQQRLF